MKAIFININEGHGLMMNLEHVQRIASNQALTITDNSVCKPVDNYVTARVQR